MARTAFSTFTTSVQAAGLMNEPQLGSAPDWHLPPSSWETHVHVFDPQNYPYHSSRVYSPVPALYDELLAFNGNLSATGAPQNMVLVQASPYGTDNSLNLDLLRSHLNSSDGPERLLRAIAVVDPEAVQDAELDDMNELGVVGLRVNTESSTDSEGWEAVRSTVEKTARRASRFAHWKCQLYVAGEAWDHISDIVESAPVQFIADHQGGMKGLSALPNGTTDVTQQPGFASLLALAKSGKLFVKISGFYRSSSLTTGGYDDLEPLIKAFAKEVPDQLIWGTDWPHTGPPGNRTEATKDVPEPFRVVDNVAVLKNIRQWVGPEVWRTMMVETPAKVYQ